MTFLSPKQQAVTSIVHVIFHDSVSRYNLTERALVLPLQIIQMQTLHTKKNHTDTYHS